MTTDAEPRHDPTVPPPDTGASTHDALHDRHDGDDGHSHGVTDRQYIIIAVILAVITAMEVTISYIDVGPIFLPALLIMMAAKFLIVVSYFMHLKFDSRIFSFLFYLGLSLAIFVYAVALATFQFFSS